MTMLTASHQNKNRNSAFLTAAIACIILAVWSALWFWASLLTVNPENIITQWEQKKIGFDKKLADQLVRPLKQSLSLNPLDANTDFLLARLYEQLAKHSGQKHQTYIGLAEQHYRKAILNQPTWDYAWAKLATLYSDQTRSYKKNNEKLTLQALMQAINLGPYERKTQELAIPLLFKYWHQLSRFDKDNMQSTKVIKESLKHRSNAQLIIESTKQYDGFGILEPLLTQQWHVDSLIKFKQELTNKNSVSGLILNE
jgi:hypothetical protein